MRLDYWFFQGYLLGLGTLVEKTETAHKAIQLIVSFNQSMDVTIKGKTHECTLVAINSLIPHSIDGTRGLQFFGYLHPESQLGLLLRDKINQAGGEWIYEKSDLSHRFPVNAGINEDPSAYQIRELWEFLLYHILGIQSYSLGWSGELKGILKVMQRLSPEELNLKNLSGILGRQSQDLEQRFFQMAGIPLIHFIFNIKLVKASGLIKSGTSLSEAIGRAGLSGAASAAAYMKDLYGLDMETLLKEKPHIRFFSAADNEQLSGHAL